MKKYLIFFGGFVAGIIVTFLVLYIIARTNRSNDEFTGLTMFSETGECIESTGEIKVFQVLAPNMALARTGEYSDGIIVLLINNQGKTYYDEQKITIPDNKCARQVGTYQYTTKDGMGKTVPAVVIE